MQELIDELAGLVGVWKKQAERFEACSMPASAMALQECRRQLEAVLDNYHIEQIQRSRCQVDRAP